jgi:hypothetical protein
VSVVSLRWKDAVDIDIPSGMNGIGVLKGDTVGRKLEPMVGIRLSTIDGEVETVSFRHIGR